MTRHYPAVLTATAVLLTLAVHVPAGADPAYDRPAIIRPLPGLEIPDTPTVDLVLPTYVDAGGGPDRTGKEALTVTAAIALAGVGAHAAGRRR